LNIILAIYLINHKSKFDSDQDLTDAKVNSCLQRVTEVLGFELAKDVVAGHLINNEFNIDKTVDQIINSKICKFNNFQLIHLLNYLYYIYNCIINYIGATKLKDQPPAESRLSRPPTVVIASSSKNKDNIIVGFGNASISGTPFIFI